VHLGTRDADQSQVYHEDMAVNAHLTNDRVFSFFPMKRVCHEIAAVVSIFILSRKRDVLWRFEGKNKSKRSGW